MYTYIWCKFSLVTKGIRVIEDQRDPVGSLALRGLLVVLDHVACRGTEELQDLVAPRDQRYVINLSKTEWLAITLHEPRLCMIVKKKTFACHPNLSSHINMHYQCSICFFFVISIVMFHIIMISLCISTTVQHFGVRIKQINEWILLFSRNALNWSKVKVETFITLQNIVKINAVYIKKQTYF